MSGAQSPSSQRLSLLACLPAIAISGLLLIVPFLLSAWRSLFPAGAFDPAAYLALGDSVFLSVIERTVGFAALVSLGCMVLGTPVAYALLRFPQRWARVMLGTISLSFLVGTLIRSYAWLAILGARGLVNGALHGLGLEHPLKLAFSFGSMLLASVQVELPLFILPLYGVMRGIDRRIPMAAQSLGADPVTAWFTTFLPLALPGMAVSTALVFLTALGFYAIPELLGPPDTYLLSQELEVRINTLGDDAGASARILVMVVLIALVAALAMWVHARLSRRREGATDQRPARGLALRAQAESLARAIAPLRWYPVALCFVIVLVLLALPLTVLVPLSISDDFYLRFPPHGFSLRWPTTFFGDPDFLHATAFSVEVGLAAAALGTLAGALAALSLDRLSPRWARLVRLLTVAPLIVSPITVTAALYLVALSWTWLDPIALFIAVYTVLALPFGFLLVEAAARRMDPRLVRAAASLGAGPWTRLGTVIMPILATAFASAFVFAFLLAFDDVSAGLFLASSDRMPLAVRLWEDLKAAITPLPASITMIAALLVACVYALVRMATAALHRRERARLAKAMAVAATGATRP